MLVLSRTRVLVNRPQICQHFSGIVSIEGGFEYNYVFQKGWEFALIQKNNVHCLHGGYFQKRSSDWIEDTVLTKQFGMGAETHQTDDVTVRIEPY